MLHLILQITTQILLIKYNKEYVDFDKTLYLSQNKNQFIYNLDTIYFKNKFLCSNNTDVVKCVNEPAKWSIIRIGNKFKIFSQQSMFTEELCWDVDNGAIKLRKCKDVSSQSFEIIDQSNGNGSNSNNSNINTSNGTNRWKNSSGINKWKNNNDGGMNSWSKDKKFNKNGNKDVRKSSTDFINNEKTFNGFDKGSNGNEIVDTNNNKGSKGIETPDVAIEGSNGNPTTDLIIEGSNGNETLDINKCTKNVDTINYGDLDPTKIYILNNCKNKIVRLKITTDNKEQICNDNNKEKNCNDNNKEIFNSIDDKEQIDSNYFNNFKKKYSCNENNKMKRAAKYIEENYINFSDVFDFYKKIEKELSCK